MRIFTSVCLVSLLSACGGGGGGGSNTTTPTSSGTAEGFYVGTTSTGYGVAALILENAETWGFYYSGPTTSGVFNGTSNGTGSTFSASGTDFNFITRSATSGTLSGTVATASSINASSSNGGTVSLTYESSYTTAASLSAIAGNYTGWGVSKSTPSQSVTFTVNSAGAISGSVSNCSVSGSITPRASGKNVYNVSTTFSGSGCALGSGVTTTGVATLVSLNGINRLIAMTLNSGKTDGYIVNGYTAGTPSGVATVPAQTAIINYMKAANSQIFNLYATNGCLGTLNSSKTNGTSQSALFEGSVRPYSTSTTIVTYTNCTPAASTGVEQSYTDNSYIPYGYLVTSGTPSNNAYYGVYLSTPNVPTSLTAGASGTIGTLNRYTNSTKLVSAGSAVVTYTSSAETSTTLLLNVVSTVNDASNALAYTATDTYRITTGGVATLLGGQITFPSGVIVYFR
jgi:hypothetical protein